MNELKFRALREKKFRELEGIGHSFKEWLYSNGYYFDGINYWFPQQGKYTCVADINWVIVDIETVGQYTGLKDKNGLQYIYEGDILGVDGLIRGNKYENPELLKDTINLVIEGFGTKTWVATYKEAVDRGCRDSE